MTIKLIGSSSNRVSCTRLGFHLHTMPGDFSTPYGWYKFKIRFVLELICISFGFEVFVRQMTEPEKNTALARMKQSLLDEIQGHIAACKAAAAKAPTHE